VQASFGVSPVEFSATSKYPERLPEAAGLLVSTGPDAEEDWPQPEKRRSAWRWCTSKRDTWAHAEGGEGGI